MARRRARTRRSPTRPRRETLTDTAPSPAPSPVNTLPMDPIYTGDVGNINLNYDKTIAGIGFDRSQVGQQLGYTLDPSNPNALQLDPSNPYSVAANLQRRYQQGQSGATNSMAAGGQLYSGALQRNLDENTYQYGRDDDALKRQALGAFQDLTEREQEARFNRDTGLNQADSDRLGRLRPEDVTPPPIDYKALARLIRHERRQKRRRK